MNYARIFPKSKEVIADALSVRGWVAEGCFVRDGIIYPAMSATAKGDSPVTVKKAWYSHKEKLIIAWTANGIFTSSDGAEFTLCSETVYAPDGRLPLYFDDADGYPCVAGLNGCVKIRNGVAETDNFFGGVFGGVIKNGRLFAQDLSDAYRIRWSGAGDPKDGADGIDGAGWVDINPAYGRVQNLVVYKRNIVVVCEYGLAIMSAFGAPENFKLQYIDGVIGKIVPDTAAVAGNKLAFCCDGKVMLFDGIKVERLYAELLSDMVNPVCAAGAEGLYFVAAESRRLKRQVVFAVNPTYSTAYIIDFPATVLCVGDKIYCFAGKRCVTLGYGGGYAFTSGVINFGTRGRKTLKSIHLGNDAPVDIEVISDGNSRILRGVTGYCRPKACGNSFKITVRASGKICGLKAVGEFADGV